MFKRNCLWIFLVLFSFHSNIRGLTLSECWQWATKTVAQSFQSHPIRSFAALLTASLGCIYGVKRLCGALHAAFSKDELAKKIKIASEPVQKQLTKAELKELFANPEKYPAYATPHRASLGAIAVSKDRTLIAYGDGNGDVSIENVRTKQKCIYQYPQQKIKVLAGVRTLAIDTSNSWIAVGYSVDVVGVNKPNIHNVPLLIVYKLFSDEEYRLDGHTDWVTSVDFSPDGTMLASISDDKDVRIWDVATKRCKYRLQNHKAFGLSVSFNADGSLLASGGFDGIISLWNPHDGRLLWSKKMNEKAIVKEDPYDSQADAAIAVFHPLEPSKLAVTATNNEIRILSTDKILKTEKNYVIATKTFKSKVGAWGLNNITYNHDGTIIVCRDAPTVRTFVWNLSEDTEKFFIGRKDSPFCSAAFISDYGLLMGYRQRDFTKGLIFKWNVNVQHDLI